jgi:hypothetical protein
MTRFGAHGIAGNSDPGFDVRYYDPVFLTGARSDIMNRIYVVLVLVAGMGLLMANTSFAQTAHKHHHRHHHHRPHHAATH